MAGGHGNRVANPYADMTGAALIWKMLLQLQLEDDSCTPKERRRPQM